MATITKPKPKKKPVVSEKAFQTVQFGTDPSAFNVVKNPEVADVPMSEKSSKGIRFNKDGTVDVQFKGGAPEKLTKEEYNVFNLKGKGMQTEKTQRLAQKQKEVEADIALRADIERKQTREAAIERFIAEQPQAEIPEEVRQPTAEEQPQETQTKFQQQNQAIVQGFQNPVESFKESAAAVAGGVLSTIASAADILRTAITGKKPLAVQQAEATFTDSAAVINRNIQAVKTNPALYVEAKKDFIRAQEAINRLESNTKREGLLSLRYWRDNGAELEASIANEKAILADLERELELARIQGTRFQLGV